MFGLLKRSLGFLLPGLSYAKPLTDEEMEARRDELLSLGAADGPYPIGKEEEPSPLMQRATRAYKRLESRNHGLLRAGETREHVRTALGRHGMVEDQRSKDDDPELKHLHPRVRQLALRVKRRSEQYRAAARARKRVRRSNPTAPFVIMRRGKWSR